MEELAVGIDLGTSNSCVAVARGGRVEVLPNGYGENTTASVVAFHQDGSIEVGNAAKANVIHDPKHTICSAKRLIGRYFFSEEVRKAQAVCAYDIVEGSNHGVRLRIGDILYSLPEISAMVLKEMRSIAEARLGQPVTKAVITVPAFFNDNQRQATKDAAEIAGLEVLRILNEPTAAALAYGFGRDLHQRVAVYDLGGGTFDISVLEIGEDVFEVLATAGNTYLGGDDFDDRLLDVLADEFVAKEKINPRTDPFALEKLKVAAEAAKKRLSEESEVDVRISNVLSGPDGKPRSLERKVTVAEYASLVDDLIQQTFRVCDEALQQASLTVRDLDGVILVGGSTRLSLVRSAVRAYFQQEPRREADPDEVVALGAAIHASSLQTHTQRAFLLDVTPLSLRIGTAGGMAEEVIERNTPVPIEQTRTFTTVQDYQESVKICVYQGESRRAEENELLGQFEFSGFKRARRSEVKIDVTFEIDTDGIVSVTARDPDTGRKASTQITLSSGLSSQEVQNIIATRRIDRVATRAAAAIQPPTPDLVPAPVAPRAPAPEPAARPTAPPAPAPRPSAPPRPATVERAAEAPAPAEDLDDLEVLPDDELREIAAEIGILDPSGDTSPAIPHDPSGAKGPNAPDAELGSAEPSDPSEGDTEVMYDDPAER